MRKNKAKFKKSDWDYAISRWDSYASPFRPSKEDIKNYSKLLRQVNKEKILILGSTSEIRKILSKSKPFIADFSYNMLKEMPCLEIEDIESRETWIKGDWMTLDEFIKNNYFDIIVGDLVLRNIEPSLQKDFLKKIYSLLKKGGYFLTRMHLTNNGLVEQNSYRIIETTLDENYNVEDHLIEDLITSRLFDKNTNPKTQTINKKNFALDINKYLKIKKLDKKVKSLMNKIIDKWVGPRTWTQRTEKEIISLLSPYFTIFDKKISTDYQDAEFYPLYILLKK